MVNLKCILVISLLNCSNDVFAQRAHDRSNSMIELHESIGPVGNVFMNGTLFQTVKRYHCAWTGQANVTALTLVLYGSKAWTFPNQDVRLDLSYPEFRANSTGTLVSMFDVILRIGGAHSHSQGYITSGGILQEFITLSFILSNISSLEYEFWLYGVPKWAVDPFDHLHHQLHDQCRP